MNEKEYNQMLFDNYVKQQKEQGLWIEREDHFDAVNKMLAKQLSVKKEKNERQLTEEQIAKNKEYFDKVKSNYYEPVMTIKKPEQKMDIKKAKLRVIDNLQSITRQRGEELVYDEDNKIVLNYLSHYFARTDEFTGDLKKGILLCGGVGTGKSLFMEAFERFCFNRPNAFITHDMKAISRDVQENGTQILQSYNQGICNYDDVGFEDKAAHFGNKVCVFTELMNIQYHKFLKSGKVCHITTNLGFSNDYGFGKFSDRYDKRIVDRVRQMFNIVEFNGNSKRK